MWSLDGSPAYLPVSSLFVHEAFLPGCCVPVQVGRDSKRTHRPCHQGAYVLAGIHKAGLYLIIKPDVGVDEVP